MKGEIAVPSAICAREHSTLPTNQPATGSWLWRDKNGDGSIQSDEYESLGPADGSIWGWEVDGKGDIWQTSESGFIRHYRYLGLDAYGSPNYIGSASEVIPMPAPFNKLERIKYFPDTDVIYLRGYRVDRPDAGEEWAIVGTEIVRYDNSSKSPKVRWRVSLPYNPSAHPILIIKAMDVVGDRVFAVTSRTVEVDVYDTETGATLTTLSRPPRGGRREWLD